MNESDLLDKDGHNPYQHLIGILQWFCMIGRADTQFSVCSHCHFPACPHKEQLKVVKKIYSYLKDLPDRLIKVDHQDLRGFPMLPTSDASFKKQCHDAFD